MELTRSKPLYRQDVIAMIAKMPPGPAKDEAVRHALKIYGPAPGAEKEKIARRFQKYQYTPDVYLEKYFEWKPWPGLDDAHPGQLEIFNFIVFVIRQQVEKREYENGLIPEADLQYWKPGDVIQNWIRVESGNGIGKTKAIAGFVNWFTDCFQSIVYTFHTSARQDELTTWKEINSDRRGRGLPGRALNTKISISEDRFAISRTTSNSHGKGEEKIKGQHNEYLGFVVDEADGVEDYVFDGIQTMESGGISVVLMMANPRSRSSRFHRLKKHSFVKTFRISSLYHPNVVEGRDVIAGAVRRDFVEKQIEKRCNVVTEHNEDDFTFELPYDVTIAGVVCPAGTIFEPEPEFMWTVLGIAPPTSLDKTVISAGRYDSAIKRVPSGGDVTRARVGVDCARSGKDFGTVYINWQDAAWRAVELYHQETSSYVQSIKEECLKLKEKGVTSLHIRVDAGYGSGVIDGLRDDSEMAEAFEDYQVFEVHFASRAYNTKDYDNVITELYYEAAESLKELCIVEAPEALEIDLTEREYRWINRAGKTKKILEPKEDFIKRLGNSPDDGDGFVLAIGPDYCFIQATIEIVGDLGQPAAMKHTSMADKLAKLLNIKPTAPVGERILIIGWPKTGKTTLAAKMGGGRSTDDVMDLGWEESSAEVSTWFDQPGPWIIEGVTIPRALRKWRLRNPGLPPPVDRIILLRQPKAAQTVGQITMGKGMDTVMNEIRSWLSSVPIEEK